MKGKDMKIRFNTPTILGGCVFILVLLCILSIGSPIHFDHERNVREKAVKVRLMTIRKAEEQYRARHGVYAGSFKELAQSGLLADSLSFIPYTDGTRFSLTATTLPGKSGRKIPVMECAATYSQYLAGLDKTSISDLTDQANTNGLFPGLKIGDTENPNDNSGNW